jgi:hypothetical protein
MPSDLLVPAFIVTLIANAILIAVAMRGLLTGRAIDEPRPAPRSPERPRTTSAPGWSGARPSAPEPIAPAPSAPAPSAGTNAGTNAAPPERPAEPSAAAEPPPAPPGSASEADATADVVEPGPPVADAPERPATDAPMPGVPMPAAAMAAATAPPVSADAPDAADAPNAAIAPDAPIAPAVAAKAAKPGRRRRFSLPPLDDDHEKVNRSIDRFLASGDAVADRTPTTTPTTVALVAVSGIDADGIAGPIERALRTAARGRGPGRVERVGPSRWRIVLAATGELAARSYGHRLRAAVEPLIAATGEPGRVQVATATVLGEPLEVANATAERRLAGLISAESEEPRAAAD